MQKYILMNIKSICEHIIEKSQNMKMKRKKCVAYGI